VIYGPRRGFTADEEFALLVKQAPISRWTAQMSPLAIEKWLGRFFKNITAWVLYAVPPYRRFEGTLTSKEARPDGTYFILVADEIIQVDWLTYDMLMVGEAIRVRATRDNEAINIDRLMP
jgi:hypothetical protein